MNAGRRLEPAVLAAGAIASSLSAIFDPSAAQAAASQDWPAFVLVAGLISVGVFASDAGLFESAGKRLASVPGGPVSAYGCAAILVGVVTAVLNLDTAAAFLTPVMIHMARARKTPAEPFLYGALLLCNAGSLLLPGSNLTNLIVAGHLHLTGATFAARMAPAWAIALVMTAAVIGLIHHGDLRVTQDGVARSWIFRSAGELTSGGDTESETEAVRETEERDPSRSTLRIRVATLAVLSAAALMILLHNAALPVLGVGIALITFQVATTDKDLGSAVRALGTPILAGLFGIAVGTGTLGRASDLPERLLSHAGTFGTAGVGAISSVLLNNLPAASLLAARVPSHPDALLVGLDVGPNLFVTGSLSAFLWITAARREGVEPSVRHTAKLGLVSAPLAIMSAVGVLSLASVH